MKRLHLLTLSILLVLPLFGQTGEYYCEMSTIYDHFNVSSLLKQIKNKYVVYFYDENKNKIDEHTFTVTDKDDNNVLKHYSDDYYIQNNIRYFRIVQSQSTPTLSFVYKTESQDYDLGYRSVPGTYSDMCSYKYSGAVCYYTINPKIEIRPNIIDYLAEYSEDIILLYDETSSVKVTQGFPTDCYPWYYQIDDESSWSKFPSAVLSDNGATLKFKGSDLFTRSRFEQLVKKDNARMTVKIDYANTASSYIPLHGVTGQVYLRFKLTAPKIDHADATAPTCDGVDNGTVTLKMSDRIMSSDELTFNLYERIGEIFKPDPTYTKKITGLNDSTIVLDGLAPGTYLVAYSNATSTIYHNYHIHTENYDMLKNINSYIRNHVSEYTIKIIFKHHAVIVTVPDAPEPITATMEGVNLSCFESGDGAVTLRPAGGTKPYDLHVNGLDNPYTLATDTIQRPFSFQHLAAGRYAIDISDTHGCESYRDTVTLTQPDPLDFDFGHTELLKCYNDADGQLWLNRLTGGTPPYTVRWDNLDNHRVGYTELTQGVTEATMLDTTLKASTYQLSVFDSNFCFKNGGNFDIKQPNIIRIPGIAIQSTGNVCPEDRLDQASAVAYDGTPPYTYIWQTPAGDMYGQSIHTLPFGSGRLIVLDANNCRREKEYVHPGPDTIRANARVTDVKCHGGNTGAIELDPTGGTGSIQCHWTDAEGREVTDLQHLTEGRYYLTMTDGMNCQAFDSARVGTTSHIRFDHTAIEPSCFTLQDGAIEVRARGGVEPYNWDGGCLRLDHIGRGMHPVSVTDAAGCVKDTLIELTAPESITPFLPERIALCANQSGRNLRADTLAYPSATYVWTHDGDVTAEGPVCTVSRPGHYRLHMEYEGCTEDKDFEVQTLGDSIAAYFLIASFVPVDDDVRAVNLSRLPADSTEWLATPNADIIQSDERELLLYFTEKGTAEIGLRTYKGACVAEYFQTVQIVDDDQVAAYDRFGSLVEQFIVSPNPSDGNFNVKVALSRACDYTLTLLSGKTLLQTVGHSDSRGQVDAFHLQAVTGVYFIQLDIPEADIRQTRKIIVK